MIANNGASQLSHLQPLHTLGHVFAGLPRAPKLRRERPLGDAPLISIGDVSDIGISQRIDTHVPVEPGGRSVPYQVQPSDVIIAARGTVIKSAVVTEAHRGAVISANLVAVRLGEMLLPEVLAAFLSSPAAQAELEARGTASAGRLALTVSAMKTLEVPVPPMPLQKKIAGLWRAATEYQAMALAAAEARRNLAAQLMSDLTVGGIDRSEGADE